MNFHTMLFLSMLSLLFVPAALAQQMDHGSGHGQESSETADTPSWALTPEQQEQVQSLHAALEEETEPLKRKLTARKLELRAALLADTPEHERIDALVAEINTITGDIFSRHVAMQVEMSRQGIYAPLMTDTVAKGSEGMMHGGKMGMKGMKGGRSGSMGMMHG
ncbi:MAG: periplasmic heavy metal sensor, partial [Desulfohalobiaceae bacterium]